MSSTKWFITAALLVVLGEGLLVARSLLPVAVSSAPVFHLPAGGDVTSSAAGFDQTLRSYQADRGDQREIPRAGGGSLTTFYFEWDRMEIGPLLHISGHAPEVCNVSSGFRFLGHRPARIHVFPGGHTLEFDASAFETPGGEPVHVYKTTWVQGEGSLAHRREHDRLERLLGSFARRAGQARVVQGGVFGSTSEDEAWAIFTEEVLGHIVWNDGDETL